MYIYTHTYHTCIPMTECGSRFCEFVCAVTRVLITENMVICRLIAYLYQDQSGTLQEISVMEVIVKILYIHTEFFSFCVFDCSCPTPDT